MKRLSAAVHDELDRVSQTLTSRIRQLAERYSTTTQKIEEEINILTAKVNKHLKHIGESNK
jgi:type I restriction enzyme M protein